MNSNTRTENSIKNISVGLIGQGLQTLLGFINRVVFIQCLSVNYLGLNGLFTNILSVLSLAELGIGSAIAFALYKPLAEKNEEQIAAIMNFYAKTYRIIGIVISVIGACLIPFLPIIINSPHDIVENIYVLYIINLFNTAISYFYSYKSALLIADQKNYIVLLCSYCTSILQLILQILILLVTHNYILYLVTQTLCAMVFNIWISNIAKRRYPCLKLKDKRIDKDTKKSLIKNIQALVITKLSGVVLNNTDNILISFFKGLAVVGVNSNYVLLTGTLNTILVQIFNGVTASVGNLNATESKEKQVFMFDVFNLMNFWLFGWSALGFVFLSSDIVSLFFGSDYIMGIDIIIIMAINYYTVGMQNAVWTYRGTLGLFRYGRYLLLVTAFLNIVLSVLFGTLWGLFGILLATFISRLLTNIWYDPYAVYKHGFNLNPLKYFYKYFKYIIILVVTGIIIYFINKLFLFNFVVKLITVIFLPNLVFFFLFHKKQECKYIFNLVKELIKKSKKKISRLKRRIERKYK